MIDELRRLLEAATPGPWTPAGTEVLGGGCWQGTFDDPEEAELVCAAVNSLPALLARLEAAEVVVEDMRRQQAQMECLGAGHCSIPYDEDDLPAGPTSHAFNCPREYAAHIRAALARYDAVRKETR